MSPLILYLVTTRSSAIVCSGSSSDILAVKFQSLVGSEQRQLPGSSAPLTLTAAANTRASSRPPSPSPSPPSPSPFIVTLPESQQPRPAKMQGHCRKSRGTGCSDISSNSLFNNINVVLKDNLNNSQVLYEHFKRNHPQVLRKNSWWQVQNSSFCKFMKCYYTYILIISFIYIFFLQVLLSYESICVKHETTDFIGLLMKAMHEMERHLLIPRGGMYRPVQKLSQWPKWEC